VKKGAWAGGIFVLLIVPYFLQSTSIAFVIRLAGIAGLYMLLALGLNLVIGFVGLLDLGFMAFYAIGAYTAAILSIHKVPFVWCVVAAVFASVLIRVIIGFPALRLRGDYLAIVTLGFGEVVRLIVSNWDSLTNGPKGLPREIGRASCRERVSPSV
jgi:branched-chain amino acid transport system permease protein